MGKNTLTKRRLAAAILDKRPQRRHHQRCLRFPIASVLSSPPDAVKRRSVAPNASRTRIRERRKKEPFLLLFFSFKRPHYLKKQPNVGILSLDFVCFYYSRRILHSSSDFCKSVFIFFVHFHLSLHISPIQFV